MHTKPLLVGIFIGGSSQRMHRFPKGLLLPKHSNEAILEHTVSVVRSAHLLPVLIGNSTSAKTYTRFLDKTPILFDAIDSIGPIAGLRSLVAYATPYPCIALACDMPFLSVPFLQKLAHSPSKKIVLSACRAAQLWEPFFARYESTKVNSIIEQAIQNQTYSLQNCFRFEDIDTLNCSEEEIFQLNDWDTPEDIVEYSFK